jgi:predicted nuclease of predicted toxin-antitoxin system
MKFLLAANMPRSAASLLQGLGHQVEDVREILPKVADDDIVAALAKSGQLVFITRDFGFADTQNYPPNDFAGIIVLKIPDDAIASQVNEMLGHFVRDPGLLARLPGRLAIVETGQVQFHPYEPTN